MTSFKERQREIDVMLADYIAHHNKQYTKRKRSMFLTWFLIVAILLVVITMSGCMGPVAPEDTGCHWVPINHAQSACVCPQEVEDPSDVCERLK